MAALIAVMILLTNNSHCLLMDVGAKCHGSAREGILAEAIWKPSKRRALNDNAYDI